MTSGSRGSVLRPIRTLFGAGTVGGMTDGQLLEQFLSGRDESAEAAFAALVGLHGSMVWQVCRGILPDPHAAEDAFQATFLILVRRAGSIRRRDAVGPWLHGVARRVALRARAGAARRRREEQGRDLTAIPAPEPAPRDQLEALHEEVDRLVEKYRAPMVLCYFEGRTHAEAARLLKCPVATVSVRLSRARERLRARLTRRGIVLPAAWAGATLGHEGLPAAMPAGLAGSTVEAAVSLAAGNAMRTGALSISPSPLADGVLRTMTLTSLLATATGMLAIGLLAAGAGWLAAGELPTPVKAGQAPAAAAAPQVTATPQAAVTPQAGTKPPAKAGGDDRAAPPVAVREEDKPLVTFFQIRDRARSAAYVIDSSGSMATRNALDVVKRELLASLAQLPPEAQFAVIFYNLRARVLSDDQGHAGLMAATASNRKRVQSQVAEVNADGGTDHMTALRTRWP